MSSKQALRFDFNGMLFALSYALDCAEHDLIGVTTNHGKRVAALAMKTGAIMGVLNTRTERQVLSACAVMHDCALSEYIQDEFDGSTAAAVEGGIVGSSFEKHCVMGEESMKLMPFDQSLAAGAVLYHHENADGSGAFGKSGGEIPQMARLIQIADTVDAGFDLSWADEEKLDRLRTYIKENTNTLFAAPEAEAFLSLIDNEGVSFLRNEKIDVSIHELLPGGMVACTPVQLMDFAGVFARIVDYKSHFTKTHSIGIAQKAHDMGKFYGASDNLAAKLYFAGALHDIGKMVVDRDILEKPDRLEAAEYKHIQTHAYYTFKILSDVPGIEDVAGWASCHHEKLDGGGYPFGLMGDRLGKWERLLACLDIYQALTEERPYKAGMEHKTAIGILETMAAKGQLDGRIISDIDEYYGQA